MVRVVLRHEDQAEGTLVGDFPPDQIEALVESFRDARLYLSDEFDDVVLSEDPLQWVVGSKGRMILEVICADKPTYTP